MIALCGTREDTHLFRIRAALHAADIPAVCVGAEFGFADLMDRLPFVFFSDSASVFAQALIHRVGGEKRIEIPESADDGEIVDIVKHRFFLHFGTDMETQNERGIRFDSRRVFFRAQELHLTNTEYRIVRFLLSGGGTYFTGEEIAAACLASGVGGVAVHICSINAKAKYAHGVPLIETRRFRGYRIK